MARFAPACPGRERLQIAFQVCACRSPRLGFARERRQVRRAIGQNALFQVFGVEFGCSNAFAQALRVFPFDVAIAFL